MGTILQKKQMSEEDIKLQYITPSILSKWSREKITMETRITDGKINLKGNFVFREKPKRADYILYLNENNPIAVVEAKDNHHAVSHGLQQAMTYAQMLDVPFAYSSNGDGFVEHDFLTGQEREFGLHDFPTEQELIARYKRESSLTPSQEAMLEQPYYASQSTYPPRYYQRNAINRTVDAIAPGEQQPEADHLMKSEKSTKGNSHGRSWRDARDGGYFSYVLSTEGKSGLTLRTTYWGNENGNREFDILIDGKTLATENLTGKWKKQTFIDVEYPIPADMLKGKKEVTLTFRPKPGNTAGGVFYIRLIE